MINSKKNEWQDFRCSHCKQLQFKYRLKDDRIIVSVKCYACNSFSQFEIDASSLLKNNSTYHENS